MTATTAETTETGLTPEAEALFRALAVVARVTEKLAYWRPEYRPDYDELVHRWRHHFDNDTIHGFFEEGRDMGVVAVEAGTDAAMELVPEYLLPAFELRRRAQTTH